MESMNLCFVDNVGFGPHCMERNTSVRWTAIARGSRKQECQRNPRRTNVMTLSPSPRRHLNPTKTSVYQENWRTCLEDCRFAARSYLVCCRGDTLARF